MMPTAAASSADPPAPKAALRDFSDRLSPMLVKELRQGLKSPVFSWGLIAMQLALAVMALVAMDDGNPREASLFFWWAVAGTVCILLPMRVANALRDEMGGNTMDTLVLTRLSAWRITLGKWLATGALQVLVAVTALPYLIMRYFAGGVNMPVELAWMGIFLLFGLVVSAVLVGLSWLRYFLMRAVVMLAALAGAISFCASAILLASRAFPRDLTMITRDLGWEGTCSLLAIAVWVAFFFLDIGASQIAPASENRSTRRRLVALSLLLVVGGAILLGDDTRGVAFSGLLGTALLLASIQAICERPCNFPPVLRPFVRRGAAGRMAGRLLYPGWHTGAVFSLLLTVVTVGLFLWARWRWYVGFSSRYGSFPNRMAEQMLEMLTIFGGMLGALILPLVIWRLFRKMDQWHFGRWLSVVLCAGLFHGGVFIAASKGTASAVWLNFALPSGGIFLEPSAELMARDQWFTNNVSNNARYEWMRARESELKEPMGIASLISLGVWLLAALALTAREMRVTRRAEEELAAALREEKPGAG